MYHLGLAHHYSNHECKFCKRVSNEVWYDNRLNIYYCKNNKMCRIALIEWVMHSRSNFNP